MPDNIAQASGTIRAAHDQLTNKKLLLYAVSQLVANIASRPGILKIEIRVPGDFDEAVKIRTPYPVPDLDPPLLTTAAQMELLAALRAAFLSHDDRVILTAIGRATLQAKQIVERSGIKLERLKKLLSLLVDRGVLANDSTEGYSLANLIFLELLRE
jgi:hypothetical protein